MPSKNIQILSRKKFSFRNPGKALLSKEYTVGQEPSQSVVQNLSEAMFETIPNVVQTAPEWIKTDPMFNWAVSDGDLMEVVVSGKKTPSQVEAQANAQSQLNEREREEAEKTAAEEAAAHRTELSLLNKADLIEHASEKHGLELSPSMRKEDMVSAIIDHASQGTN